MKICSGLQSKIYKCLVECIPDNWCPLLQRRLDALAGPSHMAQISGGGRDKLAKVMMTGGKSVAMSVIKTVCNSWATSTRYHEDVRKSCFVGCHCFLDASGSEQDTPTDSLAHYLACPLLWSLIDSACRSPCTEWDLAVSERPYEPKYQEGQIAYHWLSYLSRN